MAEDTAHAAQRTEWAHRGTRAKLPRTPHTQCNKPSEHTGEQEPSGPGQRTSNTAQRAGTPLKKEPNGPGHRTHRITHRACTPVNSS